MHIYNDTKIIRKFMIFFLVNDVNRQGVNAITIFNKFNMQITYIKMLLMNLIFKISGASKKKTVFGASSDDFNDFCKKK